MDTSLFWKYNNNNYNEKVSSLLQKIISGMCYVKPFHFHNPNPKGSEWINEPEVLSLRNFVSPLGSI